MKHLGFGNNIETDNHSLLLPVFATHLRHDPQFEQTLTQFIDSGLTWSLNHLEKAVELFLYLIHLGTTVANFCQEFNIPTSQTSANYQEKLQNLLLSDNLAKIKENDRLLVELILLSFEDLKSIPTASDETLLNFVKKNHRIAFILIQLAKNCGATNLDIDKVVKQLNTITDGRPLFNNLIAFRSTLFNEVQERLNRTDFYEAFQRQVHELALAIDCKLAPDIWKAWHFDAKKLSFHYYNLKKRKFFEFIIENGEFGCGLEICFATLSENYQNNIDYKNVTKNLPLLSFVYRDNAMFDDKQQIRLSYVKLKNDSKLLVIDKKFDDTWYRYRPKSDPNSLPEYLHHRFGDYLYWQKHEEVASGQHNGILTNDQLQIIYTLKNGLVVHNDSPLTGCVWSNWGEINAHESIIKSQLSASYQLDLWLHSPHNPDNLFDGYLIVKDRNNQETKITLGIKNSISQTELYRLDKPKFKLKNIIELKDNNLINLWFSDDQNHHEGIITGNLLQQQWLKIIMTAPSDDVASYRGCNLNSTLTLAAILINASRFFEAQKLIDESCYQSQTGADNLFTTVMADIRHRLANEKIDSAKIAACGLQLAARVVLELNNQNITTLDDAKQHLAVIYHHYFYQHTKCPDTLKLSLLHERVLVNFLSQYRFDLQDLTVFFQQRQRFLAGQASSRSIPALCPKSPAVVVPGFDFIEPNITDLTSLFTEITNYADSFLARKDGQVINAKDLFAANRAQIASYCVQNYLSELEGENQKPLVIEQEIAIFKKLSKKDQAKLGLKLRSNQPQTPIDYVNKWVLVAAIQANGLTALQQSLQKINARFIDHNSTELTHAVINAKALIVSYLAKICLNDYEKTFPIYQKSPAVAAYQQKMNAPQQLGSQQRLLAIVNRHTTNPKSWQAITEEVTAYRKQQHITNFPHTAWQKYPELLIFEYQTQLILRQDQIDHFDDYLEKGKNTNLIKKIPCGFGKTKVLLPLLGQHFAHTGMLPIMIMPEDTFAVDQQNLSITLERAFAQSCCSFYFRCDHDTDPTALNNLINFFVNTKERQGVVVTTANSIHALLLKYREIQYCLEHNSISSQQPELLVRAQLIGKILAFWRNETVVFADEVDLVLDVRAEVNLSLGINVPLSQPLVQLITFMYEFLATDSEAVTAFGLVNNQQSLADLTQLSSIATRLVTAVWDKIPDIAMLIKNTHDKQQLIDYIIDAQKLPPPLLRKIAVSHTATVDAIALLKEQLHLLLPLTLGRNGGSHYGFESDDKHIAIPYRQGNPLFGADFAYCWETVNYTCQSYLHQKTGLTRDALKKILALWQPLIATEAIANDTLPQATHSGKRWLQLFSSCGLDDFTVNDLTSFNQAQLTTLHQAIISTPQRLLTFVRLIVVEQFNYQPQQLSSTAHDLVNSFKRFHGFSGTPWNAQTYHHSLITENDNSDSQKIKNYFIAWQQQFPVLQVATSTGNSNIPAMILTTAQAQFGADLTDICALIDAGALCKEIDNDTVAQMLADKLETCAPWCLGVLYYSGSHHQQVLTILELSGRRKMCLTGSGAAALRQAGYLEDSSQLFAYFDQAHTTGTDMPQPPQGIAILTAGERTMIRDFEQGAWRMRKLGPDLQGCPRQSCVIAIEQAFAQKCRNVSVPMLFTIMQNNQQLRQQSDSIIALKQAMLAKAIESIIITGDIVTAIQRQDLFAAMQSLLVQNLTVEPYAQFGHAVDIKTEKVLYNYARLLRQQLQKGMNQLHGWSTPQFQELIQVVKFLSLPVSQLKQQLKPSIQVMPDVCRSVAHGHLGAMRFTEVQKETEVEVETVNHHQNKQKPNRTPAIALAVIRKLTVKINDARMPSLAYLSGGVFDSNLFVSRSQITTLSNGQLSLSTDLQKPFDFVLEIRNIKNGLAAYVALSIADAEEICKSHPTAADKLQNPHHEIQLLTLNGMHAHSVLPVSDEHAFAAQRCRALAQFKLLLPKQIQVSRWQGEENEALIVWQNEGSSALQRRRRLCYQGQLGEVLTKSTDQVVSQRRPLACMTWEKAYALAQFSYRDVNVHPLFVGNTIASSTGS